MSPLETVFIWAAIACYAVVSALYIYSIVFGNQRVLDRLVWLVAVAFALLTAGIVARYAAIGSLPVSGDYENGLGAGWFISLTTLYLCVRQRAFKSVGLVTMPFTLILLGYGVMRNPALVPLAAAAKSFWLFVHVGFAWLAFGAYAVAAALGVIYLLKERRPDREFYARLPDLRKLDELMFRYVVFGFITDAVMIGSGAIWARDLWGNYWSWDPVETWSLITWLIYGLAIHLRVTMGWRGRRLAWIAIVAIWGMVITYFGINLVVNTSLHLFEAWQNL